MTRPAATHIDSSEAHASKDLLRLVVVGSVDDGKSTLIGRLLYECGGLFEDHIASVRKRSRDGTVDFSLFTDGLLAEREQGITIDVAYRYFETCSRRVIVADTPGHVQYTRNMATGASTADAAIILVDARLGVLPQTRRHAFIASLLGIPAIAIAINKTDLVDDPKATYERLSREVETLCAQLRFMSITSFPVSAVRGDNVTAPSPHTPWYQGGTVLDWLEGLPPRRGLVDAPLRFPVQLVARPHLDYRGYAGTIASGSVRVGDDVVVLPSGRRSRVEGIDTYDGPLEEAQAPRAVTLRLADEVDVARGDLIALPSAPPRVSRALEADIVWFSEAALHEGQRVLIKHTTRLVSAHVDKVAWRRDLETLDEAPASWLSLNDIGRATLRLSRPVVADLYRENRTTGAFILIDPKTNDTLGAGMIADLLPEDASLQVASAISADARRARYGHGGLVVLAHASRAARLERRLFDDGRAVLLTEHAEVAVEAARAGLVVVLAADSPQRRRALRMALAGDDGLAAVDVFDAADEAEAVRTVGAHL